MAIHRLNRAEYNNTIHDLVGVNINPTADFPADDSGYGFDNIADVLSMSPLLAEKYLTAAEQVMDKAIVIGNPFRDRVVRIDGDALEGDGSSERRCTPPLHERGTVHTRHEFVASAEYELRIGADADQAGREPAKMTVKLDGRELRTFDVEAVRGTPQTYTLRVRTNAGEHRVSALPSSTITTTPTRPILKIAAIEIFTSTGSSFAARSTQIRPVRAKSKSVCCFAAQPTARRERSAPRRSPWAICRPRLSASCD